MKPDAPRLRVGSELAGEAPTYGAVDTLGDIGANKKTEPPRVLWRLALVSFGDESELRNQDGTFFAQARHRRRIVSGPQPAGRQEQDKP